MAKEDQRRNIAKISIVWVGRTDVRQTDGR